MARSQGTTHHSFFAFGSRAANRQPEPTVDALMNDAFSAAIRRWFLTTPLSFVGVIGAFAIVGEMRIGVAYSAIVLLASGLHAWALRSSSFLESPWLGPAYLVLAMLVGLFPLAFMPVTIKGQTLLLVVLTVNLLLVPFSMRAKPLAARTWPVVQGGFGAFAWAIAPHGFESMFPWVVILVIAMISAIVATEGAAQQQTLAEASLQAINNSRIDALTGLFRRASFMELVDESLRECNEGSIVFVDIDRFKVINDTLGHQAGDQLLSLVSRRVRGALGTGDIAGRVGGDEIAVFTIGSSHAQALEVATRLGSLFDEDFRLLGNRVPIAASVGVACTDDDCRTGAELIHRADTAMYEAKRHGPRVRLFDERMHTHMLELKQTELDLRVSLREGEVCAYLQPIVTANDDQIVGFEALARWTREGIVVPAAAFLASADQSNLMPAVTRAVASDLVALTSIQGAPLPNQTFGVNVEIGDLGSFLDWLTRQPVDPRFWVVEITEHQIIDNYDNVERQVQRARDLGVGVVLDDFGKGYSSLTRILRLPLTGLKIDADFVAEMLHSRTARAIVSSAVHIGAECDLVVIAEGVETREQADELVAMGVPYLQGYYFHRPATIAASMPLIAGMARSGVTAPRGIPPATSISPASDPASS